MKSILILLLTLSTINGFCQITSIWKGNTPGHKMEWDFASNWSNNRIPDEFTDVMIPVDITLGNNYPVISNGSVEVNSLTVSSGAHIQVDPGCLLRSLTSTWIPDVPLKIVQIMLPGKVELE
jgi:hypothetical protein